jgi:hypothetical protein
MNTLKQKLMDMKENAFCFVHLIADYVTHAIKGRNVLIPLEHHLEVCSKCAREKHAYEAFLADQGEQEDNLENLPASAAFEQKFEQINQRRDRTPTIQPGQIWSTPGFPDYPLYQYGINNKKLPYSLDPRLFLVHRYDNVTGIAVGFPINLDYLEFASDFDLITAAEETELGIEFMIEVWNPVSTGSEFFQKYWGTVPAEVMKKLEVLEQEFNGEKVREEGPGPIVTGKPIHFENDIRHQFQQVEKQVTEYISAPLLEKQEFEAFKNLYATKKILEAMLVYTVVYINRHKDFLRTAADNGHNTIYIYKKKQPIFNGVFTIKISINEMEKEYVLQLQIIDNETGEETRSFVVDMVQWEGPFPEVGEQLKTTYLLFKNNNFNITHIRLWEKEERLTIPRGKNLILVIYNAGDQERIEFIPINFNSK